MSFLSIISGWIALVMAGMCEVAFTTCLKLSSGFTRIPFIIGLAFFALASFALLNRSLDKVPLGTAYAVWTGIGAAGTAILGVICFGESLTLARMFLLFTLVGSIVGLKFTH